MNTHNSEVEHEYSRRLQELTECLDSVASYKIVSTVTQEFKNQLPAAEQVTKLLEGID